MAKSRLSKLKDKVAKKLPKLPKLPKLNRAEKLAALGTAVSVGTAIYTLSQQNASSSNRSANTNGTLSINKDELISAIKSDTNLQNLLRGYSGANGATGAAGANGNKIYAVSELPSNSTEVQVFQNGDLMLNTSTGILYEKSGLTPTQFLIQNSQQGTQGIVLSNVVFLMKGNLKGETGPAGQGTFRQNYGGSLIENSALELDDFTNINNAILSNELFGGFKCFVLDTVKNPYFNKVVVRTDRIIKVSAYIKTENSSNVKFHLRAFDINNNLASKIAGDWWSSSNSLSSNGSFSLREAFFGGVGSLLTNFAANTFKVELHVYGYSGTSYLSKLILKEVDLGEPVPFNLPFLPVGQMVFDPTDGTVGRYDGNLIHWFSMV